MLLEQPEDLKSMQFLNDEHNFDSYKIVYKSSLQAIVEEHLSTFFQWKWNLCCGMNLGLIKFQCIHKYSLLLLLQFIIFIALAMFLVICRWVLIQNLFPKGSVIYTFC